MLVLEKELRGRLSSDNIAKETGAHGESRAYTIGDRGIAKGRALSLSPDAYAGERCPVVGSTAFRIACIGTAASYCGSDCPTHR
jgi:hypothetical protein